MIFQNNSITPPVPTLPVVHLCGELRDAVVYGAVAMGPGSVMRRVSIRPHSQNKG